MILLYSHCRASAIGCLKHVIGGNRDNIAVVSCHPQAAFPRSTFFCRQLCGRFAPRLFFGPGLDSSCNGGSGPGPCRLHWGKSWHKFCKRSSHPPPAFALVGADLLGIWQTQDTVRRHGSRAALLRAHRQLRLQALQALPLCSSMYL